MEPAAVRSFFLVDALFLANPSDCSAKAGANIERH
jgi:hypothetical protein